MVVSRVVIPVVSAYALFLGMVAYTWRHPASAPRPGEPSPSDVRAQITNIATTVLGGYVAFLAIVLVFHVVIAGQRGALVSAIAGGAFLAFVVAMPVFAAGAWISDSLRRTRTGRRR